MATTSKKQAVKAVVPEGHNGDSLSQWIDTWMPPGKILSRNEKIVEIANALGVGRETLYRYIREGFNRVTLLKLASIGVELPEYQQLGNVNTNTNTLNIGGSVHANASPLKAVKDEDKEKDNSRITTLEDRVKVLEAELQFVKTMMTKL